MSLQDIVNTAVNIEVNRSKLVAQNVSRSGRISTASRNWVNPYRFVVTPKPIWTNAEYRSIFESIFNADRYAGHSIRLSNFDDTTGLATTGSAWLTEYQGGDDTVVPVNNILDFYLATSATAGTRMILSYSAGSPTAGLYITKKGDWIRPAGNPYPYQATEDVIIPTAFTAKTGTITASGTTVFFPNTNLAWTTTTTRTTITGITSTTGLSVGQLVSENGTNTGSFGGVTYIASVDSATQITIQSTTANTAGAITFDGTGPTSTPAVALPIHRGYIGSLSTNTSVRIGARAALFNVMVSKLPQMRFLPGQYVEFTGDFELIEDIL
jgi:hypothetical protein